MLVPPYASRKGWPKDFPPSMSSWAPVSRWAAERVAHASATYIAQALASPQFHAESILPLGGCVATPSLWLSPSWLSPPLCTAGSHVLDPNGVEGTLGIKSGSSRMFRQDALAMGRYRRDPSRWQTTFGQWVSDFGVSRIVSALAHDPDLRVTNQAVYEWLRGYAPRPARAMALVELSGGRLTLEAIYDHARKVRRPPGDGRERLER